MTLLSTQEGSNCAAPPRTGQDCLDASAPPQPSSHCASRALMLIGGFTRIASKLVKAHMECMHGGGAGVGGGGWVGWGVGGVGGVGSIDL